jgi:hypothetical protein
MIKLRVVNPYILVSKARAEALKKDWRRPMPVLVQLNGKPNPPWKINMMPFGDGRFYLYLHNDIRKPTGTAVGDKVEVTLGFDDEYKGGPLHEMPKYISEALQDSPTALANWNGLPPSRQKEVLRYFAGVKSEEAIQNNLKRLLRVLNGASERFLARDWHDGR